MFNSIPETSLEIASFGRSQNRMIVIRRIGEQDPVAPVSNTRILMIGSAEIELQRAFQERLISRPILSDIMGLPINGNTYSKLYQYIMKS